MSRIFTRKFTYKGLENLNDDKVETAVFSSSSCFFRVELPECAQYDKILEKGQTYCITILPNSKYSHKYQEEYAKHGIALSGIVITKEITKEKRRVRMVFGGILEGTLEIEEEIDWIFQKILVHVVIVRDGGGNV